MNTLRRALLLLAAAALVLTSLCACGAGGTEPTSTVPATAQSGELPTEDPGEATAEPTAEPTPEPTPEPKRNSVTVGIAQDLDSLDPHNPGSNAGTSEVLFNLFEGLVKASPDGGVVPAVASDYTVSEDGLTYTFTLREGVKFHNGAAVTAEDVLYSLNRCAGSENEGTVLVPAFSIVNAVAAPDEKTVTITLTEPNLEFILSVAEASIIPKDSGSQMATDPVGTGPFQFVSYTPQESLVVKRFEDYWGTPAKLDEVTFQVYLGSSNTSAMVMALQSGTLDMVIHMPNTMAPEIGTDFTVLQDTMKLVQALYINNAAEPFNIEKDGVKVGELIRKAMYYAIDVPAIIDFVCDGATGTSMYPAQQRYFMPELAENYAYNLDMAQELMSYAGYPDGFDMTITVPNNYEQHILTAEVIAEQLKAIHINATVEQVEWGAWYQDVYKDRNFQTSVCAISASDMSAREMLVRYASDNSKNFINFKDADYDAKVAAAQTTLDQEEQISLYKEAETILNEKAASLWIQDLCELVVLDPELEGYTFYCTYVLDMSTIGFKA